MRTLTLLSLLFVFSTSVLLSQTSNYKLNEMDIISTDSLKRGSFLSFDDFFKNNPKFTDLPITEREDANVDLEYYLVDGDYLWKYNKVITRIRINEENKLWGWSEGKRAFINSMANYYHQQITILGRFSMFDQKQNSSYIPPYTTTIAQYLINHETGELIHLTGENLEKYVFFQMPDLQTEYKADKQKGYKYNL